MLPVATRSIWKLELRCIQQAMGFLDSLLGFGQGSLGGLLQGEGSRLRCTVYLLAVVSPVLGDLPCTVWEHVVPNSKCVGGDGSL